MVIRVKIISISVAVHVAVPVCLLSNLHPISVSPVVSILVPVPVSVCIRFRLGPVSAPSPPLLENCLARAQLTS